MGYSVEAIGPVEVEGQVVSSSLIRSRLAEGEVTQAAALLGRPYQLSGEVVLGDGRGKSLGIPTANLAVWPERALPRAGVYACRAWVDGQSWAAVTNVGVRPTFETQPVLPRVEAHLLDYNSDLYGREVQLDFIARLRDEMRFASVQELVEQIHTDIVRGREVLKVSSKSA
jgi:riboflavin kinase/FMN adenylyltransferase